MLRDLRHASRVFARRPVLTSAAVAVLALGVGAGSALLAVFDAVTRSPLRAIDRPECVLDVHALYDGGARGGIYPADFLVWHAAVASFARFGAYLPLGSVAWTGDGEPRQLDRFAVSGDYFPAWGVTPRLGRAIEPRDTRPGADPVAVLSDRLWRAAFGADPGVVGRTLILDQVPHTVIGVLPPGFVVRGGEPDLFLPLALTPGDREDGHLGAVARLRSGLTLEQARAEVAALAWQLGDQGLDIASPGLQPMVEAMGGSREAFALLLPAVGLLLVLVLLNAAQLLLVLARGRRREMAIRACLGASRRRLVGQVLGEGLLLAALAAPIAVAIAAALLELLPDLGGRLTYRALVPEVDLGVLGAAFSLTLAVTLMASVFPALAVARTRPRPRREPRARRLLVIVQLALAFMLLAGAGLLVKGVGALLGADLGYDPNRLLQAEVTLPASRYPDADAIAGFYPRLLERVRATPGVVAAAAALRPPGGGWGQSVRIDGEDASTTRDLPRGRFVAVTPGYEDTVGLRLLAGRPLSWRDLAAAPPVAVVSATAAERLFGEPLPLGRSLNFEGRWHEVVGVVSDVRGDGLADVDALFYIAHAQAADALTAADLRTMVLLLRGEDGDAGIAGLAGALRDALAEVDSLLPAAGVASLRQVARDRLFTPRIQRLVLTQLAVLGLLVAALGLYGLLSYDVRMRWRELGVRVALGARRPDILRLVLGQGLATIFIGLVIGAALGIGVGRLLTHAFWRVSPFDPLSWTVAAALLFAVAIPAVYLPARRATTVDPATVIRSD